MTGLPDAIKSDRFIGIQCLRAVAAMAVLVHHIKYTVGTEISSHYAVIGSAAGAVGVDVFFVISGFVVAMVASGRNGEWRTFLIHRFARVVPFYWLMSLLFLGVMLVQSEPVTFPQLWNSFAFLPVFDLGKYTTPVHGFGWTLAFEIWFYLLFAAALAISRRVADIAIVATLSLGVIVVFLNYYSMQVVLPRFLFSPMVLEFCAGVLIFRLRHVVPTGMLWPIALVCAGLAVAVCMTEQLGYPKQILSNRAMAAERLVVWGSFAATLVLAVVLSERTRMRGRWPAWLVLLGDASYSLYLIQLFIMTIVISVIPETATVLRGLCFVLLSIGMAPLVWRYIEMPLTRFARRAAERAFSPREGAAPSSLAAPRPDL